MPQAAEENRNDATMTNQRLWMVRAGEGAKWIDEFLEHGLVAIGWEELGPIEVGVPREKIVRQATERWPNASKYRIANAVGQVFRFLNEMQKGDVVVSYDPGRRIYHVGTVEGDPEYRPGLIEGLPRIRVVTWFAQVPRDRLSVPTRNSLGAISTLFQLPPEATEEILAIAAGKETPPPDDEESEEDVTEQIASDLRAQSREFIKDRIIRLSWEEMQELVAGLLRAMGYKTRVSPPGADRGKDIIASPDGFGFEQPRIVVEVKHRPNSAMDSQAIRSFLGGRHADDKGLYVSTGGFTKDARYEAERASIPVVLMDLDDIANEIQRYYDEMDMEAKRLIPLTKIYWPA